MKKPIYTALPLKEKLINKIMIYYQTIWLEKKFTAINHRLWLSNFREDEKMNSLYLLSKFMFFGSDEIRELLISLFRDKFRYKIVEDFRKKNFDTINLALINRYFQEELNNTRFVSLGSASESGGHILMLFRQVNKLSTKNMRYSSEIIHDKKLVEPDINHYVFIDDFCGSGETAIKCESLIKDLKRFNPKIKVSYYVLFGSTDGISNVARYSSFDSCETSFILDNTFKCFDIDSRYFRETSTEINKTATENFCITYGTSLVAGSSIEGNPLGFNNGQLLLAFAHNTPDNTLPIFWSDRNWKPFFTRYIKINN